MHLLLGYVPGVRPFADFSAVELNWKDPSVGSGFSSNLEVEIGHVLQCMDQFYIVTSVRYYYDMGLTLEEVDKAGDLLFSNGRYARCTPLLNHNTYEMYTV